MRRASSPRRPGPAGLASALAGLALSAGCTHNHYYYGEATPAYVVPGETVIVDEVCELPTRVFSDAQVPSLGTRPSSVTPAPSDPEVVTSADSGAPRVVISRPSSGPILGGGWIARGGGSVRTEVQGGADPSLIR
ncbi:hypothetical protein [Tautonia plasticadhaerens]|uniref:Uncharacterized protein n=1 Tax=Tautonia plasticadhaerens TaxID=2527974 RepID=A0A518GWB8_9BACT|nr:hypothetical protein [Tautonia plasticadhaerens]QDV32885.1 hypothetical protein ElP_07250 [Tautonia plasticadhaerens]